MQISRRLKAVAALVTGDGTIADIGTDHAYIPIYLIQTGAAAHAIAMDVNPGPLARAQEHIGQYGLSASIETRLSDGLARLRPGEADSVVIAGMGGALMTRILDEGCDRLDGVSEQQGGFSDNMAAHSGKSGDNAHSNRVCGNTAAHLDSPDRAVVSGAKHPARLRRCRELILQPQSEIWLVRGWLERNGWQIAQEDMVCEEGKYYPMMRAERCGNGSYKTSNDRIDRDKIDGDKAGSGEIDRVVADTVFEGMNEMELRYGPLLLRERHPVLQEFLFHEKKLNLRILASLDGQTGEAAVARAEEVRGELQLLEEALKYCVRRTS